MTTIARVGDHVAEGFTDADLDQILRMPSEPASVARVAGIMALPVPSPSGRCHCCGLPLNRNGACGECV